MMQVITPSNWYGEICIARRKYGLYLSFPEPEEDGEINWKNFAEEYEKATPYLKGLVYDHDIYDIYANGCCVLLFDTEEEADKYFWMTVGDDGPTEENSYCGPARVYALTISPNGMPLNENT